MNTYPLVIILGATASGKTKLAIELAKVFSTDVISADSRQVYRGMNIGTGKDLHEYRLNKIAYHLIDIANPGEKYHVHAFKEDFYKAYKAVLAAGKLPLLCGGSAMYIYSLLQEQELTAVPKNEAFRVELEKYTKEELIALFNENPLTVNAKVDLSSKKRIIRAIEIARYLKENPLPVSTFPKISPLIIGLTGDTEQRREKIWKRLNERLENGMIAEVEKLMAAGLTEEMADYYGLEYKFLAKYIKGEIDYETMRTRLFTAICQYAKRQMTFFRKIEREGFSIYWLDTGQKLSVLTGKAVKYIREVGGMKGFFQ